MRYSHDFTNEPRTDAALIRIRSSDSAGLTSDWDVSDAVFTINRPPTKPTLIAPTGSNPQDNILFDWTHNDPDADPQTEYSLRVTSPVWKYPDASSWIIPERDIPKMYRVVRSEELDLFISTGYMGSQDLYTSSDGKSWEWQHITAASVRAILWVSELQKFCIVGLQGSEGTSLKAATSSDGFTWTAHQIDTTSSQWYELVWSPSLAQLVAFSYQRVAISPDGANWTTYDGVMPPEFNHAAYPVAWSESLGIYCALTNLGSQTTATAATSPDGINWTATPLTVTGNNWRDISWSDTLGLFCAVTYAAGNWVMTSPDGVNWTEYQPAPSGGWDTVEWVGATGRFIVGGHDGKIITSVDGINWVEQTNPSDEIDNFAYSPDRGVYVAVGDSATSGAMITGKHLWWKQSAPGLEATTPIGIRTSDHPHPTGYSNQRKVDRCQNGVSWMVIPLLPTSSTIAVCYYSLDDGATWTFSDSNIINGSGSAFETYSVNLSFFIDIDDYAHAVFKDNGNGYIYYRRGTPNVERTAWTWSAAVLVSNNASANYPDVVAHREGTGWMVHIVTSGVPSGTFNYAVYARYSVDSNQAISLVTGSDISIGGSYGTGAHTWTSVDFNHTGDGKTVAGSTPHVYAAWSAGATGAGLGIRFRKATYSAGSWTWGTEVEIDPTRYISGNDAWLNCLFDGTRVVIVGGLNDGTAVHDTVIYERDAADTATITRVQTDNNSSYVMRFGSATYDADGNIHIIGRYADPDPKIGLRSWIRATNNADLLIIESSANDAPYVTVKRGKSNGRIEFIYTDGISPLAVTYGSIYDIIIAADWGDTEHWNASAETQVTIPTSHFETSIAYNWTVATGD